MASGVINNIDNGSVEITVNDKIVARKNGHVVTVVLTYKTITATIVGWTSLGTLPVEYRPTRTILQAVIDNSAQTEAKNTPIDVRIIANGEVQAYLFADKLSADPIGAITYVI